MPYIRCALCFDGFIIYYSLHRSHFNNVIYKSAYFTLKIFESSKYNLPSNNLICVYLRVTHYSYAMVDSFILNTYYLNTRYNGGGKRRTRKCVWRTVFETTYHKNISPSNRQTRQPWLGWNHICVSVIIISFWIRV